MNQPTPASAPASQPVVVVPAERVAGSVALLREAVQRFEKVVYSSSLGAEAMVLTDLIFSNQLPIDIVTIDTGRLFEQTRDLLERIERRYSQRIRVVHPDAGNLQNYVAHNGINAFYGSLDLRMQCCHIRKVEPFMRAVRGYKAWITGVRHEQSETRAGTEAIEIDARSNIHKISPLLHWTNREIWAHIREHQLPYNPLHDMGYPSIGCAPCTRAIEPGQDERAGRWWWESPDSRECGLQPRRPPNTLSDL
jgi:phosphoadenosine phosphosulfate reductase